MNWWRGAEWTRFARPAGALRASVGGGFLAALVTPSGRLWRPNRSSRFVAPRLNRARKNNILDAQKLILYAGHADFQYWVEVFRQLPNCSKLSDPNRILPCNASI